LAVLGLCLLYGIVFTVVFIVTVISLAAPSSQAAQGMSMVAFVFAFHLQHLRPGEHDAGLARALRQAPARSRRWSTRSDGRWPGSTSEVVLALAWSALGTREHRGVRRGGSIETKAC